MRLTQFRLTRRDLRLGSPHRLQIYHGDTLIFDEVVQPDLKTYRTKGPLGIPARVSTLRLVSLEGTASPAALGMGDDPRQLSFVFLEVGLVQVK